MSERQKNPKETQGTTSQSRRLEGGGKWTACSYNDPSSESAGKKQGQTSPPQVYRANGRWARKQKKAEVGDETGGADRGSKGRWHGRTFPL
eukprot:5736459-Heterocapsa_arctica.AAC.1